MVVWARDGRGDDVEVVVYNIILCDNYMILEFKHININIY